MSDSKLFRPLKVGNDMLQHRIVMAPLSRYRVVDNNHVPIMPLVKDYYSQRASVPGTLLITEATFISPEAGGYTNAPGIWSQAQIEAWKQITAAVHVKGSFIRMQLWALGRVAEAEVLKKESDGEVMGPSAVPEAEGATVPQEMTLADIDRYIKTYAQAARNAMIAGFDGVEIHGANGYLIDQFIQDVSNKRTDSFGGSIENRARFALQVTSAVVSAIGAEKVGIRLSPWSSFQGMKMADPIPQFTYLIQQLRKHKLSYLHLIESRIDGNVEVGGPQAAQGVAFAIEAWENVSPVLLAGGFEAKTAYEAIDKKYAGYDVAIVFGRYFLANPDLPYRIRNGIELSPYNRDTFYAIGSPEGYTDYPFSMEFLQSQG